MAIYHIHIDGSSKELDWHVRFEHEKDCDADMGHIAGIAKELHHALKALEQGLIKE